MPTRIDAVEVRQQPLSELLYHAEIPSCYESWTVFEVRRGADGFTLHERQRERPFRKDYDAIEDPTEWPARFDISNWTLFSAFDATGRIGGAICVFDTPAVEMLEGRSDLVVVWDLRVSANARRRGVGSALFRTVEAWAQARNCNEVKVETQNTNVAACRLYAKLGCRLSEVNLNAYPGLPDEVQLIWRKVLNGS